MFRRIVVPVQLELQETPALSLAVRLAQRMQAELTFLYIVEELPRYLRLPDHKRAQHLDDLLMREAEDKLNAIARVWREHVPGIETLVLRGHPVFEIIQEVARGRYDLVIRDRSPHDEDQNDVRLVRKCSAPILLVNPDAPPVRKVLACIDPEPDDSYRNRICDRVMASSLALGAALDAEVHVLRVWSAFMESAAIQHLPQYAYDEYKREIQTSLHGEFEHFLQRFNDAPITPHFSEGDPDETIRQLVREEAIDVAIVGASSRRGLSAYFMGSTAEKILERSGCSVLTVKPEDFALRLPEEGHETRRLAM